MSTEIENVSWYLTDLGVKKNDFLAGVVVTAISVLEHLDFPEYFSKFSNRIYGDRWKFGLLVLKEYLDVSYEDLVKILPSFGGVMDAGSTSRIPHKDTLRKFSKRLPGGLLDKAVGETARLLCGPDVWSSVDGTGISMSNASRHFVKRLKQFGTEEQVVRDFAKASLVVDTESLAIIACDVASSKSADVKRFAPALKLSADSGVKIEKVLADKGYDSEKAHTDARDILGSNVETVIPVRKIEPKSSRSAHEAVPKGWYRRKMYREFDTNAYVFRNLGETVNSMIKRKMGDTAYGKSLDSVTREIKITCLAHNIRLLIDSRLVRL